MHASAPGFSRRQAIAAGAATAHLACCPRNLGVVVNVVTEERWATLHFSSLASCGVVLADQNSHCSRVFPVDVDVSADAVVALTLNDGSIEFLAPYTQPDVVKGLTTVRVAKSTVYSARWLAESRAAHALAILTSDDEADAIQLIGDLDAETPTTRWLLQTQPRRVAFFDARDGAVAILIGHAEPRHVSVHAVRRSGQGEFLRYESVIANGANVEVGALVVAEGKVLVSYSFGGISTVEVLKFTENQSLLRSRRIEVGRGVPRALSMRRGMIVVGVEATIGAQLFSIDGRHIRLMRTLSGHWGPRGVTLRKVEDSFVASFVSGEEPWESSGLWYCEIKV